MQKRLVIFWGIGLVFLLSPYFLNSYNILRLVSVIVGILLIVVSLQVIKKENIALGVVLGLVLLLASYGVDYFLVKNRSRVPIYAYVVDSSKSISTYNSFSYRVYDCKDKRVFDQGYKLNYACSSDDLKQVNVNELLSEASEKYKEYKNMFINITGKISKIIGNDSIELALYSKNENSLNGNVSFNLNYILDVKTNEDLSRYRIYDYINVVGRVSELKKTNEGYTIILKDTVLIPSSLYKEYSFEIVNSDKKELTNLVKDKNYYYYGINSVNVKYDSDNIYELSYLLTDNRFTWADLIKNVSYETIKDEEEQEIAKYYILDKFKLLDCNDKKIVVNKSFKITKDICELELK